MLPPEPDVIKLPAVTLPLALNEDPLTTPELLIDKAATPVANDNCKPGVADVSDAPK
jgi:hypothetical protein